MIYVTVIYWIDISLFCILKKPTTVGLMYLSRVQIPCLLLETEDWDSQQWSSMICVDIVQVQWTFVLTLVKSFFSKLNKAHRLQTSQHLAIGTNSTILTRPIVVQFNPSKQPEIVHKSHRYDLTPCLLGRHHRACKACERHIAQGKVGKRGNVGVNSFEILVPAKFRCSCMLICIV